MGARSYLHHVISRDGLFICAICRTPYLNFAEAETCLAECWIKEGEDLTPVVMRKNGQVSVFCKFCMRGYKSQEEAVDCAKNCHDHISVYFFSVDKNKLQRPKMVFSRPIASVKFKPKINERRTDADVMEAPKPAEVSNLQPPAESPPANVAPPAEETAENTADADKKKKPPRDRTKKFYREQAKYVCIDCKKSYFTKIEVEKCFDSHDD